MSVHFHDAENLNFVHHAVIQEHPRNPNNGDVDQLKTVITANGFYGAIIVEKSSGNILAGNHRYKALVELGEEHIPVTFVDGSFAEQLEERILLADNKTGQDAILDDELALELLNELADADNIVGSGYDAAEIAAMIEAVNNSTAESFGAAGAISDEGGTLSTGLAIACANLDVRQAVENLLDGMHGVKITRLGD